MGVHVEHHHVDLEEKFIFTSSLKTKLWITIVLGIILLAIGIFLMINGESHSAELHGAEGHGAEAAVAHGGEHAFHWTQRLFATLWVNNVFFTGIAVIGIFFCAYNYVAYAGWSAAIIRIPQSFGYFLPVAALAMFAVFFAGSHDLFHWTHEGIMDKGSENYDKIIAGKEGFLNTPFFLGRMAAYFIMWFGVFLAMRRQSLQEDLHGGVKYYDKSIVWGATFLLIFGVTSSTSAWDWVMSIDTHWFSTMFGWYVLASWHVSGLAAITLIVVLLRENGYLKIVNDSHIHDLGKLIFAFSIFWTYVWFAQFLLIFYANIPEEIGYFIDRLDRFGQYYRFLFFFNIFINFIFPFIALMTRDTKRLGIFLKIVCVGLLFGHWIDFYLMIMPGTTKGHSDFGLLEVGSIMIYFGVFALISLTFLSKALLIPKNHPLLEESMHHDI